MESKDYKQEITEIRNLMEESTRFMSLSGTSGVLIGVVCLVAAYLVGIELQNYPEFFTLKGLAPSELVGLNNLFLISGGSIILSSIIAVLMSQKRAIKSKQKFWTSASKRLLVNILTPLIAGGIFILIIFYLGYSGLVIPLMLLIYGNALLNASKYTVPQTRKLGIIEMGIGIMAVIWINESLWFWAIGFGLVHIVYGIYMHLTFEKG